MKIGDIVQRIPETFGETEIVQVVSFRVRGGVIRESFAGA